MGGDAGEDFSALLDAVGKKADAECGLGLIFFTVVIVVAGAFVVGRLVLDPQLVWAAILASGAAAGQAALVFLSIWLEARRTIRELEGLRRLAHPGSRANERRAGRGAGPGR